MKNYILNSGGKDSTFSSQFFFLNIFIKILNNCFNYVDLKYSYINCFLKKKFFLIINLKNEYNKIINFLNYKSINLDYYCNKLFKISFLLKILNVKKINTGHYFRNIKKIFFLSIDQKKDQCYFLTIKSNIYSNSGFYNKKIISYLNKKNNNLCYKKKSTIGNCFKFTYLSKIYFIIYYNIIINSLKFCYSPNIGKKISFLYIYKIFNNQIFIIKKNTKKKIILILINNFKKLFFYAKINSQSTKKIIKIIKFKNKFFIIFYKKNFFIDNNQNILIITNDILFHNSKIKKQN